MDTDAFWALIEESLGHAPGRAARERFLRARLVEMPLERIAAFRAHLDNEVARADVWSLWAAAARILGGFCSDDGFEDFRLWLVGRGRKVFEQAVAAPDSLADAPEIQRLAGRRESEWDDDAEYPSWESLAYVAADAYTAATGVEDEDAFDEAVAEAFGAELDPVPFPDYLGEDHWSARDEEAAARHIPNLARAFPVGDFPVGD